MIFRQSMFKILSGATLALTATGWGCLSMQSQTSIDGNTTGTATQVAPYVEAYVEYPGPQQKWSGPASFILHVSAKDSGSAVITMTPELVIDKRSPAPEHEDIPHDAPTVTGRLPASSGEVSIKAMSSEEARAQLSHLSMALSGTAAAFQGCMSPVRVRLVRADGGLVEKQGCRSEQGWSRAVSETVNVFINSAVHGYNATTSVAAHSGTGNPAPQMAPAPAVPSRSIATAVENHK